MELDSKTRIFAYKGFSCREIAEKYPRDEKPKRKWLSDEVLERADFLVEEYIRRSSDGALVDKGYKVVYNGIDNIDLKNVQYIITTDWKEHDTSLRRYRRIAQSIESMGNNQGFTIVLRQLKKYR